MLVNTGRVLCIIQTCCVKTANSPSKIADLGSYTSKSIIISKCKFSSNSNTLTNFSMEYRKLIQPSKFLEIRFMTYTHTKNTDSYVWKI